MSIAAVQHTSSRLAVLMFTDVVGSSELKARLGTPAYALLIARHDVLFRQLLAEYPSAELLQDTGDGYFAAFQTVSDAVRFALRFQDAMHREPWGTPEPLKTRVGIHLGELAQIAGEQSGPRKIIGMAADVAARLMSLGRGGQILLTRAAFDEARQFVAEYPAVNGDPQRRALRWMAHGDYVFHGATETIEVFEVGGDGIAPLTAPRDREKAHRSHLDGKDEILGWRPAIGLAVPQAPAWVLERKLGEGTFGEVWLARHQKLKQNRVFKFCFDAERLESFKRELTLFRLLRDALGERPDITRLYDVCLDRPPYFLETEFAPAGNLIDWAEASGGLHGVPLPTRLEIVAQVCDAVAAAHSVGVLHKDIKPSNILVHVSADGTPRPQLTDFGIGMLTDRAQLAARHITEVGFTMMPGPESSRSGTRIYAPPESLAGRPFTTQGDIYALGVLLYQMTVADLDRPMALGWERGVEDELLREDIAACVDGDPERRINSPAEVAIRLRRLSERREQRAADARRRENDLRRRRMLRIASVAALACVVTSGVVAYTYVQQQRLRASRREVQWAHAATGLQLGIAAHYAGRAQQSRTALIGARDALRQLGVSTLPSEVGLYQSLRTFEAPINTIDAGSDGLMGVGWLPDSRTVVSSGENGSVRVWDALTGREHRAFVGHTGLIGALAISADGRQVLTGGHDRTVRLWDVESGKQIRVIDESAEVRGVAMSPDGRYALSGTFVMPGQLRLRDLETGSLVRTYQRRSEYALYGVNFSPDGHRVVATTYGNDLWVWDVDQEQPLRRLVGHGGYVASAVFSHDGSQLLSASFDNTLKLWNVQTGETIRTFKGHTAGVRGAAFIGDGATALSCSMDGTLRLWDVGTGTTLRTFTGHRDGVRGLSVSPDGAYAASGGIDGTVKVWSLRPGNEVPAVMESATVTSLSTSPDGTILVSGNAAGDVTLRDVATLRTLRTFRGDGRPIECAALVSDRSQLFTADDLGHAKLWDVGSGQVLRDHPARLKPGTDRRIRGAEWCYTCVTPDGAIAISSNGESRTLDVWSPQSGAIVRTLGPCTNVVTSVAISADGKQALCGDLGGRLYHWDLAKKDPLFAGRAYEKTATIDSVAFAPHGRHALLAGHDMLTRLWDLHERKEVRPFPGHTLIVRTARFGRDGRTIFSASNDQTLRLFETETGRELDLGAQFDQPLYAIAPILPGDAVAAASGGRISVWDVSRAARYVDDEPRLEAARTALRAKPDDAAALAVLGNAYAFRGADDWAVELLERARAGGHDVPSLTLARCYWGLDRFADAAREFRRAVTRNEAPGAYLQACIAAVDGAGGPASQPTTVP